MTEREKQLRRSDRVRIGVILALCLILAVPVVVAMAASPDPSASSDGQRAPGERGPRGHGRRAAARPHRPPRSPRRDEGPVRPAPAGRRQGRAWVRRPRLHHDHRDRRLEPVAQDR